MKAEKRRYAGIDLGKRAYTMGVIGKTGKVTGETVFRKQREDGH
jgi:hypothetical protein